ncbi:MAG: trimeric intracellular cation channel family protein [Bacteroidales bacterium]|nr:trimeric intracellular cation channel family protein [Bacteroidales bacterium]
MSDFSYLYALDLLGTFVFAISGLLTAAEKRFDLFGATVIALVTALGGGTIRDMLIGSLPVGWMSNLHYLYAVVAGILLAWIFKKYVERLRRTLFLFDTIGIGIFTIVGLQKTLNYEISPIIAVIMGTTSAVFGGVVRDILIGEVPLIFRKEIYATACLLGGLSYLLLSTLPWSRDWAASITVLLIIAIRLLAVRNKWSLPRVE